MASRRPLHLHRLLRHPVFLTPAPVLSFYGLRHIRWLRQHTSRVTVIRIITHSFFLTDSHSVMSVILCHHKGNRGSMFLTGNRIYHSTEYVRSVLITCRDGLFFCRQLKNLQTSLPVVAQLVFFSRRRTALCSRHAVVLSSEHTSYCEIDALRLKKISPYDTG